jgi:DNA excision repair protein ERCC-3
MRSGLKLRYYQERALRNVIIGGKARSGLIILPCGAGKSLVAILILQRVRSNAVIFCENEISVEQWKEELLKWTTIPATRIVRLSGKTKDRYDKKDPVIFLTTYAMVGKSRDTTNPILEATQSVEWGVCIADEVHKLPAETFQKVLHRYQFHVKIGLTATPYREDKKIDNLFYMIGPKLFEENWQDLVTEGCLARPYCV